MGKITPIMDLQLQKVLIFGETHYIGLRGKNATVKLLQSTTTTTIGPESNAPQWILLYSGLNTTSALQMTEIAIVLGEESKVNIALRPHLVESRFSHYSENPKQSCLQK